MPHYKYLPHRTGETVNDTTLFFNNTEEREGQEITIIDNWRYVYFPDNVTVPEQPEEIQWTELTLTDELKEQIKANSRQCQLISQWMQDRIRTKYSLEDEQYFSRIGVGVALGAYTFQPGEQEALLAFGTFVESVRQWGRDERAKFGL